MSKDDPVLVHSSGRFSPTESHGRYRLVPSCTDEVDSRSGFVSADADEMDGLLLRAYSHLHAGDRGSAIQFLREALVIGRGSVASMPGRLSAHQLGAVLGLALESGIEPEYAKSLIRALELPARVLDIDDWPWRLKAFTLGRFSVVVGGNPIEFNGKAQQKPLQLLKALIALGGRGVALSRIAECLWPEADGDVAEQSFSITLHRLRKLVGLEHAIVISEKKATLDSRYCWVDAWAFERAADEILRHLENGGWTRTDSDMEQCAARAFDWYEGEFLAREADERWMFAPRSRLHSKFQRLVTEIAAYWEGRGKYCKAVQVCQRGLEHDPVNEIFHRRMMAAYQALGEHAEVVRVYQHCCEALARQLAVAPSAETEALYRASLRPAPTSPEIG